MIVLLTILGYLFITVASMCLIAGVVLLGPNKLYQLRDVGLSRLREVRYQVVALAIVVMISAFAREGLQAISEVYGLHLTGAIFAIEGTFVAWVQSTFTTPLVTIYFSWIYVYAYVFLLVFPFIAYGVLESSTTLKRLLTAYTLNYGIGILVYTIVFAHGPRNVMPELVTSLLYTHNPDFQALTSRVNENTNVFPSLHTSLSVTVAAFAYLTRKEYPVWAAIAGWIAVSVMLATMYLGIHWLLDVVAGIVLALGAVALSYRLVPSTVKRSRTETDAETTDDPASTVK